MEKSTIIDAIHRLERGSTSQVFVGFDGFVDEIIHVVDQRFSATEYKRIETIADFAARAGSFAGLSGNMELLSLESKLGGNGPIMANALIRQGFPTTYMGAIGDSVIHPLFKDFASQCQEVISVCDPAHTDAIEFRDGKLMFGKSAGLFGLNWNLILSRVSLAELENRLGEIKLFAFTNWTMIPEMNGIIRNMGEMIGRLGTQPFVFFDLADPTKRTDEDIRSLFAEMKQLSKHARIILGMNLNESRIISRLTDGSGGDDLRKRAEGIRSALGIYAAVIHPTEGAAAAREGESFWVDGPYTDSPRLTTGAGDNFNAGFCNALLRGLELEQCLLTGVSTSGFYVREAHSPDLTELLNFIKVWKSI
jgi:sugar/nucleoside kinase (ribokinase family)